jgi:hypothetical protein
MPISLKNSTSLHSYLRYSSQKDRWYIPDNGVAKAIDIIGKPIAMDPENGQMGWLFIDTGTRDWRPFPITDDPPRAPGPNYRRGFSLLVYAANALGSPEIFEMCSATGAHNNFCESLYNQAEPEFGKNRIPIVKITGATAFKVGKGSSADIHFSIVKYIERPAAFIEAVVRRNEGGKERPAASAENEDEDFGLDETITESKAESKAEPKTEPAPKKTTKKRAKPEPTLSDILDDEIID